MELLPGVVLVGSGDGGFGLSHPFDSHVYLLDGGEQAALVDTGIGLDTDSILERVARAGISTSRLRTVLLTHGHPDHSGGAADLVERLPHLSVGASPQVAEWVTTGDTDRLGLEVGKRSQFYPPDYEFSPCPVHHRLTEGDQVRVGGLVVEVLELPGHSDGHLGFSVNVGGRATLFSGDCLFYGGRISLANRPDCRLDAYVASLAKMGKQRVDALLPGHHSISLSRAQRHIDAAVRLLERGFLPPSVV